MAGRAFAKLGYKDNNGNFIQTNTRAQDVFDSTGVSTEEHQTNIGIHVTEEQARLIANAIQAALLGEANGVATLDADGKIPAGQLDLAQYQAAANVNTYADMLALAEKDAPVNCYVFVADATGDTTVDRGWAAYRRVAANDNADDWVKVAEGESLDVIFPDYTEKFTELKEAADAAATEAAKLDFAYCTSEEDMAAKNLRPGALILMAVDNPGGE